MLTRAVRTTIECRRIVQVARAIAGIVVAFACLMLVQRTAWADTTPTLYSSFAGYVNFVGAEKTLRLADNNTDACSVASSSTTTSTTLSGIPSTATIKAAYLYWSGSGSTPDYTVNFGVSGSMSSVT